MQHSQRATQFNGRPRAARGAAIGLFAATYGVVVSGCYLTTQATYFLRDQARARPIARVVPDATEEERRLFEIVEAARRYGEETLGLRSTGNYTRYIRTAQTHLVNVVSAAGELSFERYTWWFPVVGRDRKSVV